MLTKIVLYSTILKKGGDYMVKNGERLLKIEEVAVLLGCSVKTINMWYWFRKENPDNEYAKMLPDYLQESAKSARYWRTSDMWKMIQFKDSIPHGRNGILGSITQKYRKKAVV